MSQIIHYVMLVFIVFICAEIRNVLLSENPYQGEPVSIWNEPGKEIQPAISPARQLL